MCTNNTTNLAGNAGEVLKKNVKDLLVDGLFSDLTIVCGDKQFKVHKAILYTQSDYFKSLLGGQFREGKATVIPLDEDPEIFHALIFFLYNFSWCPAMVEPIQVVAVYRVANYYQVPPLAQLAASRFKLACKPKEDPEGFVDAIDSVLESTAPGDNTLWDILFPMVKANMRLLTGHASFKELLIKHEDLNLRLLNEMSLGEDSSNGNISYDRDNEAQQPDDDGSGGGFGGYTGGYFGAGAGRTLG